MAYDEQVVAELGNVTERYKARLIRTKKNVLIVDIREYVETAKYTGWTPKAIRIPVDAIGEAIDVLEGGATQAKSA